MDINTLFNDNLCQYASYDNIRSIASLIDGFKNSGRKIVYFSKDLANYKKVSTLKSEIASKSQYLHNEDILPDIITNFARDFDCGPVTLPLFKPLSAIGCRTSPTSAQPRYSSIKKSDYYDLLFNKDDEEILDHQYFEGQKIEPKFLLPTLPLILLINNNGMGVGFAQNIMQRSAEDVKQAIKDILDNKQPKPLVPYFKGYKGTVELLNTEHGKKQWKFKGVYEKIDTYNLKITETTPYATNESMLIHFNSLKEKKIIKDYKDYSLGDNFEYVINVSGDFWNNQNIHKLLGIETTDTENFTCADRNNFIKTYKDEIEILKEYIDVKLEYIQKRKQHKLSKYSDQIELINNKIKFIQAVLDKKVIFERKKKEDIIKQINNIGIVDNIDTLINMPLYSLSEESINSLNEQLSGLQQSFNELSQKHVKDIWLDDINKLFERL
ncbi:putative DNA topoisomerase II medium subunit [Campylobacter phage F358]|uniref:DNA topoisomerase (ATP-hydrolyzing) n=5 Tax=Fletchervirus CPX TaxID=1110702 RepID=A0A7T3KF80_9CAUD|nr:putative DNA topoisomerase II medium subunit [Campylobacter phage F357]QPX64071.1 putative DNA topoisomerase II medium subunit [Campylobacter phage F358]QPX64234.1 putative DNA topoisomerase II medium subunit [Campylobacter phage F360]QPX64399.1 putative DNA topoisomerase II medium subunit [Campylobacter phage F361]QPX64563.1 putative DNA topoisomerase II medium subunit [Campylobacter phage F365]